MKIKNTRPYEAVLVASAVIVYVINRLFDVDNHLTILIRTAILKAGVSRKQILADLAEYSHLLNAMLPVIAGAVLLLGAWLIFHLLVYPRIALQKFDSTTLLSIGLLLILVFASMFLFHWFRVYVRYNKDQYGHIIGLKIYSLYRKKTVLADAITVFFQFAFFEMISSIFRRLYQQILKEKGKIFTVVATILLFVPGSILCWLALITEVPTHLFFYDAKIEFLWIASIVIIWVLQEYAIRYVVPNLRTQTDVLLRCLSGFIIIWVVGNGLIWAANSNFNLHYYRPFFLQLIRTLLPVLIIIVFRRIVLKEKVFLQKQVAGTSAELAQLRSQINPHFLFNALNSLYAAAMKEAAEKTADGIQRLGDMMRFMLQENNQERISIEKEIEYLHNYIHLQRIRIDETQGIEIKVVLNQPDTEVYIAPMMLIPFVENTFKHGVSHRYPSWIFITLSFDATHLYFRVQNSRHIRQEADPEEYQSGIGLDNVQKRLNLLYPGRYTLQVQESDHDYLAILTLSLW